MAIDIQKFFNQQLPSGMAKHPDSAKAIGGTFQLNITGGGGGQWFIDASDSGPRCQPGKGDHGSADVTVTIATEDFQKMMEDPKNNVMQLFFSGKLKIEGSQMLLQKFPDLLLLGFS
ncbi:SCP2 sterol-binding domain-containing protein [Crocosphaera sp. XPORK-15E]|uniref:SCP2 sterol-binding domain-containing protein n=1 Tax=Crocosphaera sp. XPORK-15E TaxID=3110247 RepID=UPI002B213107|nr:SCP2 sterol-binding domain-containing protein [Crocosphaera sp. XPORK-15E]MEA5534663.1 SCP2 sterol-binding domain-containing protein [Crocosphaera sp. XPORK-15E]